MEKPSVYHQFLAVPQYKVAEIIHGALVTHYRSMPSVARYAWLVDPLTRTLEVLRLESERWVLIAAFRDAAVVRAEPFDAIELQLSVLWSR